MFIYALYIKKSKIVFIPQELIFPPVGVLSPTLRMHVLNPAPVLLSPPLQNSSHCRSDHWPPRGESVVSSQTSHQDLSTLATPSSSVHLLQLASDTLYILLVFLLFTGCFLLVLCWFLFSCHPLNVGGSQGSVLDPLLHLCSLPGWPHLILCCKWICIPVNPLYVSTKNFFWTPDYFNNCFFYFSIWEY